MLPVTAVRTIQLPFCGEFLLVQMFVFKFFALFYFGTPEV